MQPMTVIEALNLARANLQECSIPMRDAGKASKALALLAECIEALSNNAAEKKEESK